MCAQLTTELYLQIATIPFGTGLLLSFQATFTFIVDAYRPVAASGMAANSAMRSSFAMGFPLFTHTMFKNLGTQWALALCAFLCLLIVPFPFLVSSCAQCGLNHATVEKCFQTCLMSIIL